MLILARNQQLLDATRNAMGFNQPSKIQGLAIPVIIRGGNFIGQAQSGTGKTAAFSLGVLQRIDTSKQNVQALVLSPTRELCRQNHSVIARLAEPCGISVLLLVPEDKDFSTSPSGRFLHFLS
jgi:superfamily II DNA/RNA helicase